MNKKKNIQIRLIFPFERFVKSILIETVASDRLDQHQKIERKRFFTYPWTHVSRKWTTNGTPFLPSGAFDEATWTFVIVSVQSSWSQSARERERNSESLNRAALVVRVTTKEKKQLLHKHLPSSSSFLVERFAEWINQASSTVERHLPRSHLMFFGMNLNRIHHHHHEDIQAEERRKAHLIIS